MKQRLKENWLTLLAIAALGIYIVSGCQQLGRQAVIQHTNEIGNVSAVPQTELDPIKTASSNPE